MGQCWACAVDVVAAASNPHIVLTNAIILSQCRFNVPTLNQHWVNISRSLEKCSPTADRGWSMLGTLAQCRTSSGLWRICQRPLVSTYNACWKMDAFPLTRHRLRVYPNLVHIRKNTPHPTLLSQTAEGEIKTPF